MRGHKKNLDFDLNLMPVISILAVVLSILLLTTVWVRVGTFNLNQALGTEAKDKKSNPSLWVQFQGEGDLRLIIKDAQISEKSANASIRKKTREATLEALRSYARHVKELVPDLNVALILPSPESSYQDVIAVMDVLKKESITDLGIAPL